MNVETLREQIVHDERVLAIQKELLDKVQATNQNDQIDLSAFRSWPRATITTYNKKIDELDLLSDPSKEQIEAIHALDTLIGLGDQIVAVQNEIALHCEDTHGKLLEDLHSGGTFEAAYIRADGRLVLPCEHIPKEAGRAPPPSKTEPEDFHAPRHGQMDDHDLEDAQAAAKPGSGVDGPKDREIYAMLGVPHTASMDEIKK